MPHPRNSFESERWALFESEPTHHRITRFHSGRGLVSCASLCSHHLPACTDGVLGLCRISSLLHRFGNIPIYTSADNLFRSAVRAATLGGCRGAEVAVGRRPERRRPEGLAECNYLQPSSSLSRNAPRELVLNFTGWGEPKLMVLLPFEKNQSLRALREAPGWAKASGGGIRPQIRIRP